VTLTREHRESVPYQICLDVGHRQVLFAEAVARLIAGEIEAAKITIREYIVATVGFERLGVMTGESPQHLEQVFAADEGLRAGDLFEKIVLLAHHEDMHLELGGYLERFGSEPSRWDHFARLGRKVRAKWWYLLDFKQRRYLRRNNVLTCDYHEMFQERIRCDRKIRKHILIGCVENLVLGEVEIPRRRLHTYIIGAVGFERLGAMTGESPQHLEQMFNTEGGLTTGYLFEKVVLLAQHQGVDHVLSAYLDKFTDVGKHSAYVDHGDE